MNDVIASELLKVRTVRSTYGLLAAIVAMMLLGTFIVFAMTNDWDSAPASEKALFDAADATVLVIPFAQFCLAALGALVITSEFSTGMIRPSLVAVPSRRTMVAGKAAVVAGVSLIVGQLAAFVMFFISMAIAGGRPAPIWPWTSVGDAFGTVASLGLSVMIAGLVGFGIGVVVRSTAGALISIGALLFVMPSAAFFLPAPWDGRVASVMLPNLAPQLAGTAVQGELSPLGAGITMVVYLVLALGAAAMALTRRDP